MNNNSDDEFYTAIKTQLKYLVEDDEYNVINRVVLTVNHIMMHVTQFLKLFLIDKTNNKIHVAINVLLIEDIIYVLTTSTGNSKEKSRQRKELKKFYESHYRVILPKNQMKTRKNLAQILKYEAKNLITSIKNNVNANYLIYVKKLINLKFDLHENKKNKQLLKELWEVKWDIANINSSYNSDEKYHDWIVDFKQNFVPKRKHENIVYDMKVNFEKYFLKMILINQELEKLANEKNIKYRLPNTCILKKSFVPNYITLDTVAIVDILKSGMKIKNKDTNELMNKCKLKQQSKEYKYEIWNTFFIQQYSKYVNQKDKQLKKKIINIFDKKGHNFAGMIKTDGIGVSILHKKISKKKKVQGVEEQQEFKYIEKDNNIKFTKGKNVVVSDPGYSDLLHMYNEQSYSFKKEQKENRLTVGSKMFRYTQAQRKHEMKTSKYVKMRKKMYKEKIGFRTTQERINSLSKCNFKSCDFKEAKYGMIIKSIMIEPMFEFFEREIHRKLKLNSYINKQKSESKMLNKFEKQMGSPDNTIIVSGDYSCGNKHKKGNAPAKNIGLLRLFRERGYKVYLINEYNTSKTCSHCHEKVETFLKRNKKDKFKVWGLVRCTNANCLQGSIHKPGFCKSIHNRDTNACKNMLSQIKHMRRFRRKQSIFQNPYSF